MYIKCENITELAFNHVPSQQSFIRGIDNCQKNAKSITRRRETLARDVSPMVG